MTNWRLPYFEDASNMLKYCYKKQYTLFSISFAVVFGLLVLVLYILTDLISSLEIQRLQLAASSSTVFAVNLIEQYGIDSMLHLIENEAEQ